MADTDQDFESAVARFVEFAAGQGYPRELLWTFKEDVLVWRRRYFVRTADSAERQSRSSALFSSAVKEGLGVRLEAKCKTTRLTICCVHVPEDEQEREGSGFVKGEVLFSTAVDPLSVVLVRNSISWWLVRQLPARIIQFWGWPSVS